MSRLLLIELLDGLHARARAPDELELRPGELCVAELEHGPEFAHVIAVERPIAPGPRGGDDRAPRTGRILRRATLQDRAHAEDDARRVHIAAETCRRVAAGREPPIKFVRVKYNLDRSILIVRYSCEETADARELGRRIEDELRVRVDLRQIGVRDETALIGGLGLCGQPLCCARWLRRFEPVNVKMAKAQGLALNPAAIGGACGRLKCCLRFEHAVYTDAARGLPRPGERVLTPQGPGRVIAVNILARRVTVAGAEPGAPPVEYAADDLTPVPPERPPACHDRDEGECHACAAAQRSEPASTRAPGARDLRPHHPG